jgi:MoxR-like ATPase
LTLYRAVQGLALFSGRDYAIPDDIKALAGPVLAHRVVPKGMLRDGLRVRNRAILQQLLGRIPVPR